MGSSEDHLRGTQPCQLEDIPEGTYDIKCKLILQNLKPEENRFEVISVEMADISRPKTTLNRPSWHAQHLCESNIQLCCQRNKLENEAS